VDRFPVGLAVLDQHGHAHDDVRVQCRRLEAESASARLDYDGLALFGRRNGQRAPRADVPALQFDGPDVSRVGEVAVLVGGAGLVLPAAPERLHDLDGLVQPFVLLQPRRHGLAVVGERGRVVGRDGVSIRPGRG
jgi:hypothetical protein